MSICKRTQCSTPAKTRKLCERHYRQRVHMGIYKLRVDTAPVLEHIEKLRALGWTWNQIGQEAEISSSVAHGLHVGRFQRLLQETYDAIMSVPLVQRETFVLVDPTGTRRRVEALAWMGWTRRFVATEVGLQSGSLATLLGRGRISARTAARVATLYVELSRTEGPSPQAATKARIAGYAPPAAWDDEAIDDPQAKPNLTGYDEDTVQALLAGELPEYDLVDLDEVVRRMPGQGSKSIANQLGISWHICQGAVERVRRAAA